MFTQTETRYSSKELSAKITVHIQELADATETARLSEAMLEYLDMCARFYKYSPNNIFLIQMACPYATQVAGFKKWRSMGRYVRKGESGIPILAPILVTSENEDGDEEEVLVGFRIVHVYDISQTEGEPLPAPPDWKSPEQNALLQERLMQFAESKGIKVEICALRGEAQGASFGGRVVISPEAGTKTLIHEVAHEVMHREDNRPYDKAILELEAESVAFVVGKHFGLEGVGSPNYVAVHGADANMIIAHLERIKNTAKEVIEAIEISHDF